MEVLTPHSLPGLTNPQSRRRAAPPACGLLLRAAEDRSGSGDLVAGSATLRKSGPSATDFCFDLIPSSKASSAQTELVLGFALFRFPQC